MTFVPRTRSDLTAIRDFGSSESYSHLLDDVIDTALAYLDRAERAESRIAAALAIATVAKIDEDRPEWILGYNDALYDVRAALRGEGTTNER